MVRVLHILNLSSYCIFIYSLEVDMLKGLCSEKLRLNCFLLRLQCGEVGVGCDATLIGLSLCHHDVTIHTPVWSPTTKGKIKLCKKKERGGDRKKNRKETEQKKQKQSKRESEASRKAER